MRTAKYLCTVLILGCTPFTQLGLIAEDSTPKRNAKEDFKLVSGTWRVFAIEIDGMMAPPEALTEMRWWFKDNKLLIGTTDKKGGNYASVKIDSRKRPIQMDAVIYDGPGKGTMYYIFKVEKDRLTLCAGDPDLANEGRPTKFTAVAGSNQFIVRLERVRDRQND